MIMNKTTKVFYIDGDEDDINLVRRILSDMNELLCSFHNVKRVDALAGKTTTSSFKSAHRYEYANTGRYRHPDQDSRIGKI